MPTVVPIVINKIYAFCLPINCISTSNQIEDLGNCLTGGVYFLFAQKTYSAASCVPNMHKIRDLGCHLSFKKVSALTQPLLLKLTSLTLRASCRTHISAEKHKSMAEIALFIFRDNLIELFFNGMLIFTVGKTEAL